MGGMQVRRREGGEEGKGGGGGWCLRRGWLLPSSIRHRCHMALIRPTILIGGAWPSDQRDDAMIVIWLHSQAAVHIITNSTVTSTQPATASLRWLATNPGRQVKPTNLRSKRRNAHLSPVINVNLVPESAARRLDRSTSGALDCVHPSLLVSTDSVLVTHPLVVAMDWVMFGMAPIKDK